MEDPKFIIEFCEIGKKTRKYDGSSPEKVFSACLEEFKSAYREDKFKGFPEPEKIQEIINILSPDPHYIPDFYRAGKLAFFIFKKVDFVTMWIHKPKK